MAVLQLGDAVNLDAQMLMLSKNSDLPVKNIRYTALTFGRVNQNTTQLSFCLAWPVLTHNL